MILKLTDEQRDALDRSDGPVPVEDSRTHRLYFLVDESALSALRQQEDQAAVQVGIADMEAARVLTLEELDARIQARLTTQPPG